MNRDEDKDVLPVEGTVGIIPGDYARLEQSSWKFNATCLDALHALSSDDEEIEQ